MCRAYFHQVTFVFIFSFVSSYSFSQCIPDTTLSGIYAPDVSIGLPDAFIGQSYESVIFIRVPADTQINIFQFTVDSMVLQDISGLPNGIGYNCNTVDCQFLGGDFGCINLTGFPVDTNQVGDHPLLASFLFYLSGAINTSVAYNITDYTLKLNGFTGIRDKKVEKNTFAVEPNPANLRSKLIFDLPASSDYMLKIYSLLGTEIAIVNQRGTKGHNEVGVMQYVNEPGVYFITLAQGDYVQNTRFIVQ